MTKHWKSAAFGLLSGSIVSSATSVGLPVAGNERNEVLGLVPGSTNIASLRELDTTDVINTLLDGFEIEIPFDKVSNNFGGLVGSVDVLPPANCKAISLGSVDYNVQGVRNQAATPGSELDELVEGDFSVNGIRFTCKVNLKSSLFGNGNVEITSTSSSVASFFQYYSQQFGYIIPTFATSNVGKSCANLIDVNVNAKFDFGSGIANFFINAISSFVIGSVTDSLVEAMCPSIESLAANVTDFITNNPLVELAGDRTVSPDISEMINVALNAETEIVANHFHPENTELVTSDNAIEFFSEFLPKLLDSPYVVAVTDAFVKLQDAVQLGDAELLVAEINSFVYIAFGVELDLTLDQVNEIINSEQYQLVVDLVTQFQAGEITIEDLLAQLLAIASEFLGFEYGLPFDLSNLPVNVRKLQEVVPPEAGQAGFDFSAFLNFTVADVVELLGDSPLSDFLLSFGSDTLIVDVLVQLFAAVDAFFGSDGSSSGFHFNFDATEPLPQEIVDLLGNLAAALPELQPYIDLIISNGNTLEGVFDQYLTVSVPIEGFADVSVSLSSFDVATQGGGLFFENAGAISPDAPTIILPGINASDVTVSVGVKIGIDAVNGDTFEDVIVIQLDINLLSQLSALFAMDFDSFGSFTFARFATIQDLPQVVADFAQCGSSSLFFAASSEITHSSLTGLLQSTSGDLAGFLEDLATNLFQMYLPAIPTVLENFFKTMVDDSKQSFIQLGSSAGVQFCDQSVVSPSGPPTNPNTSGGKGDEIFGLDQMTFIYIVAGGVAGIVLIASIVTVLLLKGKKKHALPAKTVDGDLIEAKEAPQQMKKEISI